jgi:BirA family biotin operon repressor/biotin-[acetyl-CoA-carboxylase] ligase
LPANRPALPQGYRLSWHETLDSTSEEAKRRAEAGERGPLWIVAERQSEGRGRHGRIWESLPGNLTATLLVTLSMPAEEAARLSFVSALAVADLLDAYLPGLAHFKWPNDILIRRRKIAGILLETSGARRADAPPAWLSIGIGVNLAAHPSKADFPATSLAAEGVPVPDLSSAVEALAGALDRRLQSFQEEGFPRLRALWLARAAGFGEPIRVRHGTETMRGRFGGIDEGGALILEEGRGKKRILHTGDVFFGSGEGPND